MGVGRRHAVGGADLWRVRLRFTVGMIIFVIVFWIAFGIVTRAR
jgi:hypothetical protein